MEPQSIPLKDIHLPAAVSWWPIASGWWLLILLSCTALLIWYFRSTIRAWFAPSVGTIALKQLDAISTNNHLSSQQKVQRISQLLRQSAISVRDRDQVAGLSGDQWLEFLDGENPQRPFSKGEGRVLIDAPYRPEGAVNIDALIELTRDWLKHNKGYQPNQEQQP